MAHTKDSIRRMLATRAANRKARAAAVPKQAQVAPPHDHLKDLRQRVANALVHLQAMKEWLDQHDIGATKMDFAHKKALAADSELRDR